ncbi:MAG: alpha/beta fold hydrolase [Dissulfurispiraceae bacterium]
MQKNAVLLFLIILGLLILSAWEAQAVDQVTVYDANLEGYSYPFEVKSFFFSSQGQTLRMAYMDVVPKKANGQTVLLLHGKNFCSAYWEPTIRALVSRGYRAIAPDQIGFGKSSKPEYFQFIFQELATDTRALLDSLHIAKVSLVGHSIGGMLATRFALMFPDRVERLVLVDPIGLEDWKRMIPYKSIDELYANELKSSPDTVRDYMKKNYFGGNWKPEYESLVDIQAGWIRGPDWPRMARLAALTTDMAFTQPVLYEFGDLKMPVLLIVGQKDSTALGKAWAPAGVKDIIGNYRELGRRTKAAIPDCRLVEIEGAGHLPQVERFDAYWQAVEGFLEGKER